MTSRHRSHLHSLRHGPSREYEKSSLGALRAGGLSARPVRPTNGAICSEGLKTSCLVAVLAEYVFLFLFLITVRWFSRARLDGGSPSADAMARKGCRDLVAWTVPSGYSGVCWKCAELRLRHDIEELDASQLVLAPRATDLTCGACTMTGCTISREISTTIHCTSPCLPGAQCWRASSLEGLGVVDKLLQGLAAPLHQLALVHELRRLASCLGVCRAQPRSSAQQPTGRCREDHAERLPSKG